MEEVEGGRGVGRERGKGGERGGGDGRGEMERYRRGKWGGERGKRSMQEEEKGMESHSCTVRMTTVIYTHGHS